MTKATSSRRRAVVTVVWALSAAAALGVGYWAGRSASTPPSVQTEAPLTTAVAAREGSLGQRLAYAVNAQWPTSTIPASGAGTITQLELAAGTTLEAGDTALTVDLRPVVVAEGTVPMFRDLAPGSAGADVDQLRRLLRSEGADVAAAGKYDAALEAAVRRWQGKLGIEQSGTVGAGDVVFLPRLPATVVPADEVTVGAKIAPGQALLAVPQAQPTLTLQVGPEHVPLVPVGAIVEVAIGDQRRVFEVQTVEPVPESTTVLATLSGRDGGPVCEGDDCADLVAPGGSNVLAGQVVVVPETTGTLLPDAAVHTQPDGSQAVTLEDGQVVVVNVLAASEGMVIVDEVEPGQRVLLEATRR